MEEHPSATVKISIPDDEMDLPKVAECLIAPALIAWGFSPEIVYELLQIER